MRKDSYAGKAKDVMELLEASHLVLEGENILNEAKTWNGPCLGASFPWESTIWFEVKWHIKQYKIEKYMDPILLELDTLNFNMIQAKLQMENLGIKEDLSLARNRLVESFLCAAGVAFEPNYTSGRKWLTKVIIFVLVIDDVYDIYASFEELKPFTMTFERWDEKDLEELPEYIRICVHALKDVRNEIAYEILFLRMLSEMKLPYLKKVNQVTDMEDFLPTYEDLVYNVSLVIQLCNDLGTTVAERERGDTASSILCYMNEMNVSEEKARKKIQDMINKAWKKINGHCSTQVASIKPFLNQAINAARMAHTLYQNEDAWFWYPG
ncbi:hypothetical protein GYH30_016592 [Glycine max]|nr:hypothetical protein GYH30_016592 [Glycine max]